jgi:hypothetical protein
MALLHRVFPATYHRRSMLVCQAFGFEFLSQGGALQPKRSQLRFHSLNLESTEKGFHEYTSMHFSVPSIRPGECDLNHNELVSFALALSSPYSSTLRAAFLRAVSEFKWIFFTAVICGFSLREKPLGVVLPVYTNSDNAIGPRIYSLHCNPNSQIARPLPSIM